MKALFSIVAIAVFSISGYAQYFEGMIEYNVSYRSHIMEVPTEKLAPEFGTNLKWYIKAGKYRKEYNGSVRSIELYNNTTYTLETYNPTAKHWNQVPTLSDAEIQEVEIIENAEMILDKSCNEIILHTDQGLCRFLYPSDLKLDANSFSGHMMGSWFEYLNLTGAMPLSIVITTKEKSMYAKAIAITPQLLEDSIFSK